MTVIGITGPTGAGKTTLLRQLEQLGGGVIDCDAVYHKLLESNLALQCALQKRFGDLRDGQGGFDRKKLGRAVFQDETALSDLGAITHPYIGREIDRLIAAAAAEGRPAVAVDAIALVESGRAAQCDVTIAIIAPAEQRICRIMMREGISRAYAQARVAAQKPDCFYIAHCTHTLHNDGAEENFVERARALLVSILAERKH